MIRKTIAIAAVVLSACPPPVTDECGTGLPACGSGLTCVAGKCTAAGGGSAGGQVTAGGSAGGQVTAGGSAGGMTAGGMTAGGMTAGGMAGGAAGGAAAPLCDGGCEAWAVCNGAIVGGRCEQGVLTVSEPVEGGSYDAGTPLPLLASLVLPDGGAWPTALQIPAAASWGQMTSATTGMRTTIAGAAVAGSGLVTFGWDGGPQAQRNVSFVSCTATCEGFQRCVSTTDGGFCATLPLTVSITTPATDGLTTNDAGLQVQVTITSADGGMPSSVPVAGPGMAVIASRDTATSSTYTASVTLSTPDGTKTIVAGWDAGVGFSAQRTLIFDSTPPTVAVVVQPPTRAAHEQDPTAPNVWKKDESALVAVTVTDVTSPVQPVTAAMVMAPGGSTAIAAPGVCASCTPATGNAQTGCTCFRVPLERATIAGARGPVTVGVVGALDRPGNAGNGTSANFTVTRFKWAKTFAGAVARPVAIGDAGVVFAAASDATNGRLTALNPDGTELWAVTDAGVVTAGPAVGASVWVGTRSGANVAMSPFSLAGAPQTQRGVFGAGNGFEGDFALTPAIQSGMTYETPIAMREGSNNLIACGPATVGRATSMTSGTPVVVARTGPSGGVEVFINRGGTSDLAKYTYNNAWLGNGANTLSATSIYNLVSLATGPAFLSGSGGVTNDGMVMLTTNAVAADLTSLAPSKAPIASPTTEAPYGPSSVSASSLYAGNASGALRRFVIGSTNALTGMRDEVTGLGDLSKSTPVLGKGGLVYVVNGAGNVKAVQFSASVNSVLWSATDFVSTADGIGQPALDVVRDSTGAAQCSRGLGVLYVPTVAAGVATVTAVIVDSPGLDPLAPWPKYQRDNRNSGFADSTSPAACP